MLCKAHFGQRNCSIILMAFKLIVSGVSGRIGAQVLEQALLSPSVSSVVALSRRALPDLAHHQRLEIVVMDDFTQYSEEVIAKLSGADGCIWLI
jgi:dihydrodipicolinate reductase